MKSLLTIAIPTYNRSRQLEINIINIIDSLSCNIKLFISDNASDDDTARMVEQYMAMSENISYQRNSTNIGYDGNIIKCIDGCSSEYIWLLSDDDYITLATIKRIYNILEEYQPDGMLINSKVINPETNSIIFSNLNNTIGDFQTTVNQAAILKYGKWSTLVSSMVIRHSVINTTILNQYIGSCFIQIPIFWRSLYGKSIYICGDVLITKNDSKAHNFSLSTSQIWLSNWVNTVHSLKDLFGKSVCEQVIRNLYSKPFYTMGSMQVHMIIARMEGILNLKEKATLIQKIGLTGFERVMIELLVLIPRNLIKLIYFSTRKLKKLLNKGIN